MIDLRTVFLIAPALLAMATLVLALAWAADRRARSLQLGLTGMLAVSISTVLVGLRGAIPPAFSVLVANALLLAGTVALVFAVARLIRLQRKVAWMPWATLLWAALAYGGIVYFQIVTPSLPARILAYSVGIAGIGFALLTVSAKAREPVTGAIQLVRVAAAALLITGLARIGLSLRHFRADDLFHGGLGSQLAIVIGIFGMLALGLAVLWLYQQRLVLAEAEAQATLIDRDRQLAALEDNLPGILFQWEEYPDGQVAVPYVAGRVTAITGLTSAEIVADPGLLHVHEDDRAAWTLSRMVARDTLTDWTFEGRFVLPDGSTPWWRGMARPVEQPDGSVRFYGVLIDVTDQHRYLEDLRESHALVEDQAIKLREAATAARLASKAKSEFIASMSHELRTPLNAILGFSEILSGDILHRGIDPTYRSYADDINGAGVHLLGLIDDLIDLSKVEAGRLTLQPETVPVATAVEESIRLLRNRASNHHLKLVTRIDPNVPPLYADRRAVRQILFNLLSNAIKFTPERGRITVTASAVPAADGGPPHIRIAISDTGIGIPEEDIPELFTPFFRAGNAERVEGTGLGLNLVKTFVETMGGTVDLTSTVDIGTTVVVTLRSHSQDESAGPSPPHRGGSG